MCVAFYSSKAHYSKLPIVRSLQTQAASKLASGLRSSVAYRNPKRGTVCSAVNSVYIRLEGRFSWLLSVNSKY